MPFQIRWIFGFALLLSIAFAQPKCNVCWDGSMPTFYNGACSPCPLQEVETVCDLKIKEFCESVKGNFDTKSCACYIQYLPTEEHWQDGLSGVDETSENDIGSEPVPWEGDANTSDDKVEWISDNEYRDFLKSQYTTFGSWYLATFGLSLISTFAVIIQTFSYGSNSEAYDVASFLIVVLLLENYIRLILYAMEWVLRWFGRVGKLANWLMWYSVKLLLPFQIATGLGLAMMMSYSATESDESYWYVVATYGLWNWVVTTHRASVLEYLTILRAEAYKPIFDWEFFSQEDVTDDGYVIINEDNWMEYQIASHKRQI